jgi:hypothetical protein
MSILNAPVVRYLTFDPSFVARTVFSIADNRLYDYFGNPVDDEKCSAVRDSTMCFVNLTDIVQLVKPEPITAAHSTV